MSNSNLSVECWAPPKNVIFITLTRYNNGAVAMQQQQQVQLTNEYKIEYHTILETHHVIYSLPWDALNCSASGHAKRILFLR